MSEGGVQWLLDLGNSRVKLARLLDGRAVLQGAWPLAPDEVVVPPPLLAAIGGKGRAWLASSASAVRCDAAGKTLLAAGLEVQPVVTQARCGSLRIAYAEPARLGVDRFLGLLAASGRDDGPWLVVSVGSALTIDLLAEDGGHQGGLIALSPTLHREALAARITHLDVAGGHPVDFANDTADALASGAMASALGAIERCQRLGEARLGRSPTLLLTGGGADQLLSLLSTTARHCPQLVLDGLAEYARSFASLSA